ncbi:Sec-independent protein translocase subunit TatA [Streptomyces noursei]|uniref:Sec-independent protein translocase protein TatA n=1 Tax=Streptomyces noursei TaxID=1971 RepID=A0A401RC78_STRNR|nr:Sec-independent protein translocase subunit TatA [Streptomyces noursei]EXU90635.1 preprotein translocase subunit TatA [Streptomyces noursei PD-1]UWS77446.1 Sec-independent protein translocase subunit TatA [Streptomyces noursei]GCB95224.1 Sec-independent protein translocase protein TatA [Streptomyces noursei]
MFRNALEPWHLLILVAVVVLLFGSKKLPDTARALGKSLRILKSETKAMKDDGVSDEPRPAPEPAPGPEAQPQPRTISGAAEDAPTAPTAPTARTARTAPTDGTAGR